MKSKANGRKGGLQRNFSTANPFDLTDKHWKTANLEKMKRERYKIRQMKNREHDRKFIYEVKLEGYED